jgi:hypothetical protein
MKALSLRTACGCHTCAQRTARSGLIDPRSQTLLTRPNSCQRSCSPSHPQSSHPPPSLWAIAYVRCGVICSVPGHRAENKSQCAGLPQAPRPRRTRTISADPETRATRHRRPQRSGRHSRVHQGRAHQPDRTAPSTVAADHRPRLQRDGLPLQRVLQPRTRRRTVEAAPGNMRAPHGITVTANRPEWRSQLDRRPPVPAPWPAPDGTGLEERRHRRSG